MTEPLRRPEPGESDPRAHYRIQYPVLDRPGFRVRAAITGTVHVGHIITEQRWLRQRDPMRDDR